MVGIAWCLPSKRKIGFRLYSMKLRNALAQTSNAHPRKMALDIPVDFAVRYYSFSNLFFLCCCCCFNSRSLEAKMARIKTFIRHCDRWPPPLPAFLLLLLCVFCIYTFNDQSAGRCFFFFLSLLQNSACQTHAGRTSTRRKEIIIILQRMATTLNFVRISFCCHVFTPSVCVSVQPQNKIKFPFLFWI